MSNKKQTAVDFFFEKIKSHFKGDLLEDLVFTMAIAKQKEKEQIMDAFDCKGVDNDLLVTMSFIENTRVAEQYYKETYTDKP